MQTRIQNPVKHLRWSFCKNFFNGWDFFNFFLKKKKKKKKNSLDV